MTQRLNREKEATKRSSRMQKYMVRKSKLLPIVLDHRLVHLKDHHAPDSPENEPSFIIKLELSFKEKTKNAINLEKKFYTSMKIPSTPTATAVLAMHGINSRRPPLATPPPSNYINKVCLCLDHL